MARSDFRKCHTLSPLKSSEMGRKAIFFDSESRLTKDQEHIPYLLCATFARYDLKNPYDKAIYAEGDKRFHRLTKFWIDVDNFVKKGESVTVYSHNAFYDMVVTYALPELTKMGYKVMSFFEKGLTFFMKLQLLEDQGSDKKSKVVKTLDFISTTNYFSTSLRKLAETFGFPEKMEFDYDNGTLDEAIPYCLRDVEIIVMAMESFRKLIKEEDLGPLKQTIAGQAFAAYRHTFMNREILIHNNERATNLERDAYYGGRVECFRIGIFEGDFYKTDVNSMYPFAMRYFKYPVKLVSYKKQGNLKNLKRLIKNGWGAIAKVKIKTDKPNIPFRGPKKLIFPVGEFEAGLATPELIYCIEHDLIESVSEVAIYEMDYIFVDYIDYFYGKRLEAKELELAVYVAMYKLFLNSLYGKFGQRSESWERIGDAEVDKVQVMRVKSEDGTMDTFKIFGGSIFKRIEEKESFNSFCAIAAHVTSNARMLLADFIETAGRENLYYCDTDSLFVSKDGYENLLKGGHIHNKELGKLKLEETGTYLEINAPKDYNFNGHIKLKGVKLEGMYCDIETKQLRWEGYQWPRLNGMLSSGQLLKYQNRPIVKRMERIYNGGWITNSGSVLPFKIKNDKILNFNQAYTNII